MKHFTKIGMSAALLFGMTAASFAQDAGVSAVLNPGAGSTIYPNVTTRLSFTLASFSSTNITSSNVDTVYVDLKVGGTVVQTSFATPDGTNILPGNSTIDLTNNQPTDWSSLGIASGNTSICVQSRLVKNGANVDTDGNNDETCIVVTYAGDNNPFKFDLDIQYGRINAPLKDTGSYLPIPFFPSELAYDLYNRGNTDIFPGVPYSYDIVIAGGAPQNIGAATSGFISQGGSEPHTVSGSFTLPMTPGAFEICFNMVADPNDTDNSNDSDCGRYIMGNPDGIEDYNGLIFGDVFYNGSELRLTYNEKAKGVSNIVIHDASGRMISENQVNLDHSKEHSIDVTSFNSGVYIVNITVEGKVMPYRFVVK